MVEKFLMPKWLFKILYKKWLWNDFHKCYDKILEVKGWRTARVETKGGTRSLMSPCFKIFGINFD